jgi:hypothetical protein
VIRALALLLLASPAHADKLVGLAPALTDDARLAVPIGPAGEVYEPDGKGKFTRVHAYALATPVTTIARGAIGVVIGGGGAIYRLADNGWTAIRLAQKGGKTLGGNGRRALAAIGSDLFDLDRAASASGEPLPVARAPGVVTAIGGGAIATDHGLARLEGTRLTQLREHARPISERWAIDDGAAYDLRSGKRFAWPVTTKITAFDAAPDGSLVAVGATQLLRVTDRVTPIAFPGADAVGVVADRAGRIAIAFRDGRIAIIDPQGKQTETAVEDRLPAPIPGGPPATSP